LLQISSKFKECQNSNCVLGRCGHYVRVMFEQLKDLIDTKQRS